MTNRQAPRLLRQRGAELRQSCEQCAGLAQLGVMAQLAFFSGSWDKGLDGFNNVHLVIIMLMVNGYNNADI